MKITCNKSKFNNSVTTAEVTSVFKYSQETLTQLKQGCYSLSITV